MFTFTGELVDMEKMVVTKKKKKSPRGSDISKKLNINRSLRDIS